MIPEQIERRARWVLDTLGAREAQYTHGTSAQRMTWFRRGFDSGDARNCDTFAVRDYRAL